MKKTLLAMAPALFAALMMSACTTTSGGGDERPQAAPSTAATGYKGVQAFKDICLATAPSFRSALNIAKNRYGMTNLVDVAGLKFRMSPDNSLSAQVDDFAECSITTPVFSGDRKALRAEFNAAVSRATGVKVPPDAERFQADFKGVPYAFTHSMTGGEAFVMLNLKAPLPK
ncbi:MAG: hypothetical protein LBR29_02525 [Methylobacteriaceae bacterium]|jgi:hypothetical protein|nr:hypothetical protein [Methylobacteriaceae bacterium]